MGVVACPRVLITIESGILIDGLVALVLYCEVTAGSVVAAVTKCNVLKIGIGTAYLQQVVMSDALKW